MLVDDVKVIVDEGQYTFPPTLLPTASPTISPTTTPTASPSKSPSNSPTPSPSSTPTTSSPTASPSGSPSLSMSPTMAPSTSLQPSSSPTPVPTGTPTSQCDSKFPAGADKVVLDQNFDSSSGSGWNAQTAPYSPGADGTGQATAVTSSYTGGTLPALRLSVSHQKACLRGETQLAVYFKAKLLNMTDNDSPIDCTPGVDCPSGRFRIRDKASLCNGWPSLPRNIVSWNKDEWNDVSTLFTVPSSCDGSDGWHWFFLDITMGKSYPADTVKMLVDDVKVIVDEGQYIFPQTIVVR